MGWNLLGAADDTGPWALIILIGGIILIGALAWDQLIGVLASLGAPDLPGAGFGIFIGLVLIGVAIAMWFSRNR
jgi:hypothetical protein